MKQPFSVLVRKKHLGVIVEKTWKPLAQFRITEKVKAREAVLFLHDALVGCPISGLSLCCGCAHIDHKSRGPIQLGKVSPYPKGESLLQGI